MKSFWKTPRKIEVLIGLLATVLLAVGLFLYALNEPYRIEAAQTQQIAIDLDAAMTVYAQNCTVCHGQAGEGIGAAPALNRAALQSMDPVELTRVIARGRVNTAMSAWDQAEGGPLSAYQVDQLVLLVQQGDWQAVAARVGSLDLAPRVPFTTQPDPQILARVQALLHGDTLVRGLSLYAEQCVACHGADGSGTALAPALNAAAPRARTPEELTRIITSGVAGTRMAAWGSKLPAEDVAALVALVKAWDQVPAGAVPAPDRPMPVTQESLALGSQLYASNCSRCHGPEGQGTQRAPALNVRSFFTRTNDVAMQQIISLGVPGTAMPAWGERLTETEIQAIVGFVRSWEANAPEVANPLRGPWWRTSGQTLPSGGLAPGSNAANQVNGQQTKTAWQTWLRALDWRSLVLIAVVFILGVSLSLWGILWIRRTLV